MDEFEAIDPQSVMGLRKNELAIRRLHELAEAQRVANLAPEVPLVGAVVGGNGLDVKDSVGGCSAYECKAKIIDSDMAQILQYFDCIVMEGPSAPSYAATLEQWDAKDLTFEFWDSLGSDVQVLKHLQVIGADSYISFQNKPFAFCARHMVIHEPGGGLEEFASEEAIEAIVDRIAKTAKVSISNDGHGVYYCKIRHPLFEGMSAQQLRRSRKPTKKELIRSLVLHDMSSRSSDGALARKLELPLVSLTQTGFFPQAGPAPTTTAEDVAVHLSLPILSGLSTGDFIKLRESEYDHFERFRTALGAAFSEGIEKHGSDSPERIAAMVERNYIAPGFAELRRRLDASTRSLSRKSVVALAIATTAVAVGAISAMPLVIAAGVAAAATPIPQAFKFFEEKQAIELSEMYFLWKVHKLHR